MQQKSKSNFESNGAWLVIALTPCLMQSSSQRHALQQQVDTMIMKYVVGSLISLRTVEKQPFIDLVKGLAPTGRLWQGYSWDGG